MEENQEITAEASNKEVKERENISTMPRRANSVKGVERLKMKFMGKKYGAQFNINLKIKYQ